MTSKTKEQEGVHQELMTSKTKEQEGVHQELKVTFTTAPSEEYRDVLEKVKAKGVNVCLFQTPSSLQDKVPSPIVTFEGKSSHSREFGYEAGLSLIADVLSGQLT